MVKYKTLSIKQINYVVVFSGDISKNSGEDQILIYKSFESCVFKKTPNVLVGLVWVYGNDDIAYFPESSLALRNFARQNKFSSIENAADGDIDCLL